MKMADNPITQDLSHDLPENWQESDIISPNGTEVGKSVQHGYNYLMKQVNNVQKAALEIGDAFEDLAEISDIPVASSSNPVMDGVATSGISTNWAKGDHRHPTDTTRASQTDLTNLTNRVSDLEVEIEDVPLPATANPLMDGTVQVGSATKYAREDHRHPTDTSRAAQSDLTNLTNRVNNIEIEIEEEVPLPAT